MNKPPNILLLRGQTVCALPFNGTLLFAPAKYSNYNARLIAAVAQLVEQRIRNAKVASSIPASGTSNIKHLAQL